MKFLITILMFLSGYATAMGWEQDAQHCKCELFAGVNHSPPKLEMHLGEHIPRLHDRMISTRSYYGRLQGFKGRDRSWDNEIESVYVPRGFRLLLFVNEGFDESAGVLRLDGVSTANLLQFSNVFSSAICLWTGDIAPTSVFKNFGGITDWYNL